MREENFILDAAAHTIHIGGTEYSTQCDEEMASLVRLAADCEIPAQSPRNGLEMHTIKTVCMK